MCCGDIETGMDGKLPVRKRLRLEHYDYSSAGAYFVTICIQDRKRVLSEIVAPAYAGDGALDVPPGGDKQYVEDGTKLHEENVPQIRLKSMGKIIEKHLLSSERIQGVTIDQYVIMPDHIHVIIFLDPEKYSKAEGGTSRAPSPANEMLPHIVSTFKRFCNKEIGGNVFQRSYDERVIRDSADYEAKCKYIYENPIRWYYDKSKM